MANRVSAMTLGVDVCKDWLDICDGERVWRIANTAAAVKQLLSDIDGALRVALEPTQRYHYRLLQSLLAAGHTVYLVDGYRVSRYRDAVGLRAKTDACDARLLHRYVSAEAPQLQPYYLAPKAVRQLQQLLRARARLTVSKGVIGQSLQGIGTLAVTRKALLARLQQAIRLIDRKLQRCLETTPYGADAARCRAIPGIGPLTSVALVATYHRGSFRSADAYIAYLGMDIRVRESGRYRGQSKLSKRGDPELRRLLFNAARSAARTRDWRDYYERQRARGRSTTAAYVALARKLARVAYALLRDQSNYREVAIA